MIKKPKKKKLNRKTFCKTLEKLCKDIVIKRDGKYCQVTGQAIDGCNCQMHHIFPRSRNKRMTWIPLNCILLSFHSHIFFAHKDAIGFTEFIKEKHPKLIPKLKKIERELPKGPIKEFELLEMKEKLTKQLEEM